jgi:hypothetical protein
MSLFLASVWASFATVPLEFIDELAAKISSVLVGFVVFVILVRRQRLLCPQCDTLVTRVRSRSPAWTSMQAQSGCVSCGGSVADTTRNQTVGTTFMIAYGAIGVICWIIVAAQSTFPAGGKLLSALPILCGLLTIWIGVSRTGMTATRCEDCGLKVLRGKSVPVKTASDRAEEGPLSVRSGD